VLEVKLAEPVVRHTLPDFPATAQLLISGGDDRIALDPDSGLNKYGCSPHPDASLLAFGSSTASVVSPAGYTAAQQLRERLSQAALNDTLAASSERELQRIRQELLASFGLSDAGVALVFATSGTDAHAIVARSVVNMNDKPLTIVMVEESETGSGVSAALQVNNACVLSVALRLADGAPRALADVDVEVSGKVDAVIRSGGRVLLVMVDQSKTGLIAPGHDCVAGMHRRYAGGVEVLVDACQLRLAPTALRDYLRQGFMVAVTGSKFLTGPSFSAALLLPDRLAKAFKLPHRDEHIAANAGLLLRWEAALAELRRFDKIPADVVLAFMQAFAQAVTARLNADSCLAPLAVHPLVGGSLHESQGWDAVQSIFPFLLYQSNGASGRVPLTRQHTMNIYRSLPVEFPNLAGAAMRCQFGQPVACGMRDGKEVSALRLCISARLISDAAEGSGMSSVIAGAMAALDKTVSLVRAMHS